MTIPLIIVGIIAVALLGSCIWVVSQWRNERTRAEALAVENGRLEERLKGFSDGQEVLADAVRAQAADSAEAVADQMVRRAAETFEAQEKLARSRIDAQLKPVADTLARFEAQVTAISRERAEETGSLKEQIAALLQASQVTQDEARKLSTALRRGAGVQGRWGEETLRNVLEAAGLHHRFDFDTQVSTNTDEGRRRPDVIVKLPGEALFPIDAKVSLNAFLESQEAVSEVDRSAALLRHAQSLRSHAQSLASKAYWQQFESSPDFVAMFVPGDGFLAAALECMPDLMSDAMDRRVLIVTPTTLFALCKAVAYGWRVEEQAENAREIADLGQELYRRLSVMGGHVAGLGKALSGAVMKYNAFVGSLESQVLTQARRFKDLQVEHASKPLEELESVDADCRPLAKLSAPAEDPEPELAEVE